MNRPFFWACAVAALLGFVGCGDDDGMPATDAGMSDGGSDSGPVDAGIDSDVPPACPDGTSMCGDACVDTDSDRANCGTCGTACAAGEACLAGTCAIVCPSGQTECDAACVDTTSDRAHCGACGAPCDPGELCVDGSCALSCPTGQTVCGAGCADTTSDPAHCGGCDMGCAAGEVCSAGMCAASCGPGLTECTGACVDVQNDPAHCSACDMACGAPSGATGICSAGMCRSVCDPLMGDCNADLAAGGGDGCETPLATDVSNCGACGRVCSVSHAVAGCAAGACTIAMCDAGFDDCDASATNGCETDIRSDALNCGACGMACATGERCFEGACVAPVGEACADAVALTTGRNSVIWTATAADYLTTNPSCATAYTLTGPDVVMSYTATVAERVTLDFGNPAGVRWVAVASTATCGMPTPTVACMTDTNPMTGSFTLSAGQTAYVYLRDTTSGTSPLSNPLTVDVTSVACDSLPPVEVHPANGSTTSTAWPVFRARFFAPVIANAGTITITGDMGTSLSYDLSATPAPSQVTFSAGNSVMTINPGVSFPAGEALTLSWTGLQAVVCTTSVTIPPPTWGVTVVTPPCTPGTGGVVGTTASRVTTGAPSLTEYYVVADESPTGFVYFGGTTSLYRARKTGGAIEDIESALGTDNTFGYAMLVNGSDIFTLNDLITGTGGRLFRISTDGGATWLARDYATFPRSPGDDFRGLTVYGGRIYMVTDESTTAPTEIWSVDASATTLPALARHELDIPGEEDCSGIARDATHFYIACGTNDRIVRVPVTGGPAEIVTTAIDFTVTVAALHGDDLDGDGNFDVLYAQADDEGAFFVCGPGGTSPFADWLVRFGTGTGNYGMGFDRTANVLWMLDDDTRELVSIQ